MTTPGNSGLAVAPNANIGRLYYLEFTIPAGTSESSPYSETWPLEDNLLVRIDSRIPPGPSGTMGFRIMWAQQQIVPWGNNSWLIADNEQIPWIADTAMTVSGLVVEGYNTGNYEHTIYMRALVQTLSPATLQAISETTGSIALPASQVGPESTGASTYTAPSAEESESEIESETEPEGELEEQPVINSSVSLVASS